MTSHEMNAAPVIADSSYDFGPLEQAAFTTSDRTEGVVVQHDGRIVYERYEAGYDATKRHVAWSVSKSIGSALLGLAVDEQLLSLEDSVCRYLPAAEANDSLCETKVVDTVQMTSGLRWSESYTDPATSNVLPMLYGDQDDMGRYVSLQPRAARAGSVWRYSSGDSNLLARVIRAALRGRDMRAWANERLFVPAGLTSAVIESDRSGTMLFSSGVFMTPRDMARFGQLYLDGGMAETKRVLPGSWVAFTTKPVPPRATPTPHTGDGLDERGGSYGASFWLNAATPDAPTETLLYAGAPRDTFCAQGQWGQRVCMIPSRKLVVVRVGDDRLDSYDVGPVLAAAVAAVDQKKTYENGARR